MACRIAPSYCKHISWNFQKKIERDFSLFRARFSKTTENMAAIRHNLQQEIFRPSGEALYAVVNVVKVGGGKKKEKKTTFLCAAGVLFRILRHYCHVL